MAWSDWYRFSEIFEYYGPVDENAEIRETRKLFGIFGKEGHLHTDDGFRLRSMDERPLIGPSLDELPCPLQRGDIGCYMFRIDLRDNSDDSHKWDYIGLCAELNDGIRKRLMSHFRKLCDLPNALANVEEAWCVDPIKENPDRNKRPISWKHEDIRGTNQTENFAAISAYIRGIFANDPGAIANPKSQFFEKYVKIRLLLLEPAARAAQKVAKAEGLALAAYRNKFGYIPKLNSQEEIQTLENFIEGL